MRVTVLFLAAALSSAPAAAQQVSGGTIDASQVPTKAEVASVKASADAAKAAADAAAQTAASACMPMAATPPVEVPGGSPGSGQNCRLVNAADNRISRTGQFTFTTAGAILCGGSTTCIWKDTAGNPSPLPAGASSYPVFFTPIGAAGTASVKCKVASSSNVGFVGATCVQANLNIALAGSADVSLFSSPGQVFILSLPSTQANQ